MATKKKTTKKNEQKEKKIEILQPLRGMKDILPKDESYWLALMNKAEEVSMAYNFAYMETPVVEETALFERSIGEGTDVVDKEMYVFKDRDEKSVALRPEFTAGIARAFITHGMHTDPQPVKVWSYGPVFRYDRPQAGRYRQFHQYSCETIGVRDAVVDAELISTAYFFLKDLGINTQVHINSIGSPEDRQNYIVELVAYLRSKRSYLSDISKKRINKNPLRVLDSKEEQDQPIIEEAPQIIDWLSDDAKKYFMDVLEYLDEIGVPYVLTPTLVRGLDYYTDTVFELFEEGGEDGSQSALGGGGRYDLLIEQLGGQETPACGFALGLERVVRVLRRMDEEREKPLREDPRLDIYFAQLGEQGRRRALGLIEVLRQADIFVHHNLGKSSLKAQLEVANKVNASHALILGQKEVQDGTIIVRDMESGIQEVVDQNKIVKEVKKIAK